MSTCTWPLSASACASSSPIRGSVMSPSRTMHFFRRNSSAPASPSLSRSGWNGSEVTILSKNRRSADAADPLRTST